MGRTRRGADRAALPRRRLAPLPRHPPAGRALAVPPAVALAASWAIAPFIHGSFYCWGETYRAAESLGDDRAGVDRLLAMADDFGTAITVAYWVNGILVGLASLWIVALIVRGRTAYPAGRYPRHRESACCSVSRSPPCSAARSSRARP
ncbi:hypothetical protein [Amycolatopsis sp. CA-230715]|uniref:hypothetical protein n=1 Tax=Amycolatopsis sp. CA-230715 TaxID=2745196 RepID=UPI001C02D2A5|nr:hypothetical protein [Amycolatopsis sp. CA-230715]